MQAAQLLHRYACRLYSNTAGQQAHERPCTARLAWNPMNTRPAVGPGTATGAVICLNIGRGRLGANAWSGYCCCCFHGCGCGGFILFHDRLAAIDRWLN